MKFNPSSITRAHILKGIKAIEEENLALKSSTRWNVIINGKSYPPKEVMRFARFEYDGSYDWPKSGGWPTNDYLEKMDFEIVDKSNPSLPDPLAQLIKTYKCLVKEQGLKDELYKWELLEKYKGRPDTKAKDFKVEITSIDYANLIYHTGITVIKDIANRSTEKYREQFQILFNEEAPLQERLDAFSNNVSKIYHELVPEGNFSHFHDERTMATLLTYHNPEKYTFYKSSFYKKFCKLQGVKPQKASKKYVHYLSLLKDFVANYIANNGELLQLVEAAKTETSYKDDNHLLLAQDVLFRILEETKPEFNKNNTLKGEKELRQIIQSHNKQDIFNYFSFLDAIVARLNIQSDDSRVVIATSSGKLNLTIGQRYCWNLFSPNYKRGKFGLITMDKINDNSDPYDGSGKQPCYTYFDNYTFAQENKKSAFEAVEYELSRTTKSGFIKYNNEAFRKAVFDKAYRNQVLETTESTINPPKETKMSTLQIPLNQILYGPPGTGKTFRLQDTYFKKFTVSESSLTRKQYLENMIADKTWWQVLSMTVLDLGNSTVNDIMEHELTKTKIELSNSKLPRTTVWGRLQAHTVEECENVKVSDRSEPRMFFKDDNTKWSIDKDLLEQYYPEAIENLENSRNFHPSADKLIKNYEFVTFHQSFSYEDFIEGIKPQMEEQDTELNYEITDGVFKKLALRAKADPDNNYAVFIDEINRGNVSAIFGELITLIEEDKRADGENPLSIKLPYSKKEFEVPSNLYIIGTMNTADRSVEALDTALRRRFSFKEIIPKPHLLNKIEFDGFSLDEVLKTINERIEFLLDRDHTIGHSYFMNLESNDMEGLEEVFKNKVIPLLQEYFYHDYEKIALILGPGFVKVKTNHAIKFPRFDGINEPDNVTLCELKEEIDDIEAAVIQLLYRDEA